MDTDKIKLSNFLRGLLQQNIVFSTLINSSQLMLVAKFPFPENFAIYVDPCRLEVWLIATMWYPISVSKKILTKGIDRCLYFD